MHYGPRSQARTLNSEVTVVTIVFRPLKAGTSEAGALTAPASISSSSNIYCKQTYFPLSTCLGERLRADILNCLIRTGESPV